MGFLNMSSSAVPGSALISTQDRAVLPFLRNEQGAISEADERAASDGTPALTTRLKGAARMAMLHCSATPRRREVANG